MTSFAGIESVAEERIRQKSDRHIVFLLTHGFVARVVVRSGLAGHLVTRGARVTVISRNADEVYFQQECQAENISLEQNTNKRSPIAQRFRGYRPYLLDDVLNNPALRSGHLCRRKSQPLVGWAMEAVNRTVARSPLFRKFSRTLECKTNRSREVQQLLLQLQPDLLVLCNPFGVEETVYLLHARESGIPVVCQMLSWDNITTKGTPLLMPDYFISWGPIMTEELVDLYHFPRNKVYECGVPHSDVHVIRARPCVDEIVAAVERQVAHGRYAPSILYGDGHVSERIAEAIARLTPYVQKRLHYVREAAEFGNEGDGNNSGMHYGHDNALPVHEPK